MKLDIGTVEFSGSPRTSGAGSPIQVYLRVGNPRLVTASILLFSLALSDCGDGVRQPSHEELRAFELAMSDGPALDMNRIVHARVPAGPYRLVPGDVLHIEIPLMSETSYPHSAFEEGKQSCNCRINEDGTILLPLIGELNVAGKSLPEIESSIAAAYCRDYVKGPFPVYASVHEYKTQSVSVVGAVTKPGIYALRQDQMSLVALLMEAGGVVEGGAAVIRIMRPEASARAPAANGIVAAAHLERAERATGSTALMVFEREGPLNTTGWLSLTEGSTVRLRRWVDIGSSFQRESFFEAAVAGWRQPTSDDLTVRLSRLAVCLESDPREPDVPPGLGAAGWETTGRCRFVTHLDGSGPTRRVAGVKAVLKDAGSAVEGTSAVVALPVRGLNIPFADVALEEGDTVMVEWPYEQFVSVIGLVNKPGNFPYPPDAQYNLIQAIAFAGGLDMVADPRYVSVYRLKGDGTVAHTTVRLVSSGDKEQLTEALAVPLKPGDVVSVEHTMRTRTNVFFDRIFRINLGLYLSPERLWQND